MKIAIFSPNIMKTYGGLERSSYWLYKKLENIGCDTTFIVLKYNEQERYRYDFDIRPKNIVIDPQNIDATRKILKKGGYDCVIVFASNPVTPFFCDALKGTKLPWIYAERNDPSTVENVYYKWKFKHAKEKRINILNNCSAIVLQIEEYSKSIPIERRSKLRIIPNTCAIKRPDTYKEKRNKKVLLSLGRLFNKQKQISILINAFDIAVEGLGDWELHIYGTGPDENALKRLANSKTNRSKIKFKGLSKDPSYQYSTADIFCLPSKYEGFPNTVVEAFTYSLPVIAFRDCVSARNIIKNGYNGLLADKMDAKSLSNVLMTAMSSDTLINDLSIGALETSKMYDEDAIFEMWIDTIKMAIKNRSNYENSHEKETMHDGGKK